MQAISPRISAQQAASVKRGNFAAFTDLMALYEHNYILLKQIFTGPGSDMTVQCPNQHCCLQLTPLEQERYTTTVLLTYNLLSRGVLMRIVQLKVRIYRDTRQAELLHPAKYLQTNTAVVRGSNKAVVAKWMLNRFLNRLLESARPARDITDWSPLPTANDIK